MVLSDKSILDEMDKGNIIISDFKISQLNPNTVDLTLAPEGLTYGSALEYLDCKSYNSTVGFTIPNEGMILEPNTPYLFCTMEVVTINGRNICATVCGKSSVGRLFLKVHETAGFIDTGFTGNVTLEVTVEKRLKIYPKMPICQLKFEYCSTEVLSTYKEKKHSKYIGNKAFGAQPSLMRENFKDNK